MLGAPSDESRIARVTPLLLHQLLDLALHCGAILIPLQVFGSGLDVADDSLPIDQEADAHATRISPIQPPLFQPCLSGWLTQMACHSDGGRPACAHESNHDQERFWRNH